MPAYIYLHEQIPGIVILSNGVLSLSRSSGYLHRCRYQAVVEVSLMNQAASDRPASEGLRVLKTMFSPLSALLEVSFGGAFSSILTLG